MHPEIRIALVVISIALAAVPAWLAGRTISGNASVLSSWQRAQGKITSLAADDSVEIELGVEPDTRRVNAPVVHQLGVSFLKKVPVYVDPADASNVRLGGLLQMWLWPSGLILVAMVFLMLALFSARVGLGTPGGRVEGADHWTFSTPPPPLATDIRVHRPASEWKMPLVWSLLGVAMLALGIFVHGNQIRRLGAGALGLLFILAMIALSVNTRMTEVSADRNVLRKTTAFGWREVAWSQVGRVERQELLMGVGKPSLFQKEMLPFPGRSVKSIVFTDRNGRALVSMSDHMEPESDVRRLLDLCAAQTGLHLEFKTLYNGNL